jgi:hypothetical protein
MADEAAGQPAAGSQKQTILDAGSKGAGEAQPFTLSKEVWGETVPQFPEGTEDGIKNEASIKSFVDKEGKLNTANLLKSYVNAQKMLGKDKVVIPRADGPDAELDAFYEKLGWSKDTTKYELKSFEEQKDLTPEFKKAFKDFAHKNRLPAQAADKFAQFFNEQTEAGKKQVAESSKKRFDDGVSELKKEWGTAFERKIQAAKVVINEHGGEEFNKYLRESGLGDDTKLVKFLANLSESIYGEEKLSTEAGKSNGLLTIDEAVNEKNNMYRDPKSAYLNAKDPGHAAAVQRMLKLNEIITGKK